MMLPRRSISDLRRAAAGFSLPGEVKDGPGYIRVHFQVAPEVRAHGLRPATTRKDRGGQSAHGRGLHRPQIHLHATGRRPGVDNSPRAKSLAVRIANAVYQSIDILALVLRNFGIELSKRINAAGEQRA
jgi:hypothetical protein